MYGIMEAQLENYMEKAFTRPTSTGQYLLLQLETRLDNVVYRLSFADSRRQARQLVLHGHFAINGRKTDIPSYHVKEGDTIAWQETRKKKQYVQNLVQDLPKRPVPEWLELDAGNLKAVVKRMPNPEELDIGINTRQIVEYYSR
jgi:small subunit ribosomal protein S4